jgi:short-subunit dehydrogenase
MRNSTALITGASSGIGRELAKLVAKDCSMLVLVARSLNRLQELKQELETTYPVSVKVVTKDLSKAAAAHEIYVELEREHVSVDILINVAGFGGYGAFVETDWRKEEKMIGVNILATTEMTKLFAKGMVDRKSGKIMNVSSTAAFEPGPLMSVYYASKAYVLSFSEAIANELSGTGVTVTALCPGPTATGFARAAGIANSRLFKYAPVASAEDVARYGYRAMMKGKTVAIHGMMNKVMAFSVRLAPEKLLAAIVRGLHKTA